MKKNALISVSDKTGVDAFAQTLINHGYTIYSSGGTAKFLQAAGIEVTDVATLSGFGPVLDHRVVTLAPQIHGGLLATPEMRAELDLLGWPKFDLLYVNFYPLEKAMTAPGATLESCIASTDIGGPTMVRSAVKGGDVIVMVLPYQMQLVTDWLYCGEPDRSRFLFAFRKAAEETVAEYVRLSAEVYQKFTPQFPA